MSTFDESEKIPDDPLDRRRLTPLPTVQKVAPELAALLGKYPGVALHGDSPRFDLVHEDLGKLWEQAYDQCARNGTGLIVHFIGHGIKGRTGTLYLAAKNTDSNCPQRTAANIGQWLDEVEATGDGPPALFLLDVCGAGRVPLQQWLQGLPAERRRAWVIAACAEDGKAYKARFSQATATVLSRLKAGWIDLSPSLTHVPLETFAHEIDRELARLTQADGSPPQRVMRTAHPEADSPVLPLLKNPGFRETPADRFRQYLENGLLQFASALDPALDPLHFVSRASGSPHQRYAASRCFFTGREKQLESLKKWLTEEEKHPVMVVTGSPGSGKSALLGVMACLAHPQLAEVSRSIRSVVPRQLRFDRHPLLAAVHARQRDPDAVLASIARQLGLGEAPERGWTVVSVREVLNQKNPDKQAVVVVDALDEASLDTALLRSVLLPLATSGTHRDGTLRCKVLIGVRPWWDRFPELGRHTADPDAHIDLDRTSQRERETDLRNYLADLLEEAPAYNGLGSCALRERMAKAVARRLVAVRHRGSFLLASVYAHYLAEHDRALTPEEAVQLVPSDLPGMLELHLGVLAKDRPSIRAVLVALAHGRGQGMPLEIIHAVAGVLTPPGERPPDLSDTQEAIEAASFYVRSATDTDGRRLYRFFHQSLSDHLVSAADHRAVLDAVLASVPGQSERGAPVWDLALPYVLRHAAEHAKAAHRLDDLLRQPPFLVHAGPTELRAQLPYARSLRARRVARIVEAALRPEPDPWVRWEWLLNSAVSEQETWLQRGLEAVRDPGGRAPETLTLQWGSPIRDRDGTLPYPEEAVFTRTSEGLVAVTSHAGGGVQIWDAQTGGLLDTLVVNGGHITALAAATAGGDTLVAAGDSDARLTVWNLETRSRAWTSTTLNEWTALAVGTLGGNLVVAASTWHTLTLYTHTGRCLWGVELIQEWLAQGEGPLAGRSPGDSVEITSVAIAEFDGRPAVIAGTTAGTLEVWDADGTGHRSWPVHSGSVWSVLPSRSGTTRTVACQAYAGVHVVDVDTGTVWDRQQGTADSGHAVALIDVEGEECVVTQHNDRVQVRSLRGDLIRSLTSPKDACVLAVTGDGGRLLAVTESRTSQVDVVSQVDSMGSLAPWDGHDGAVIAVALTSNGGRHFAVSLDDQGVLHTWDTTDGLRLSTRRFRNAVSATAGVAGGRPLAFVCDSHGAGWALDLADGTTRYRWQWPRAFEDLSWAQLRGRPVLAIRDGDGQLLVADAENPVDVFPCPGEDDADLVTTSSWAHDGEHLVVHTDRAESTVTAFYPADGRRAFSFCAYPDDDLNECHVVEWNRRLCLVTTSSRGTITVWSPFDETDPVAQTRIPGLGGALAVSRAGVLAAADSRIFYFAWASAEGTEAV
ncbi:AAA family ATPase [Streptomyces sp. NPDC013187]|uniref:AAA family ATPase n=1 Tax=Streptomyces sp. NPDC013187 TaxID=3364865 RepID=UPI00369DE15D